MPTAMLELLFTRLPDALTHRSPAFAAGAVVVGAVLWLAGGRFSRGLLALGGVAVGALVGVHLPRWYGWPVDGAAVGVGAAIALGTAAYAFHRTWVGVLFGATLAFWGGLAVFVTAGPSAAWNWPILRWSSDLIDVVVQVAGSLPPDLRGPLLAAGGCGLVGGVVTTWLWPRVGRALCFSLVGLSVVATVGLPVPAAGMLNRFPSTGAQVAGVLALLAAGAGLQLWLMRKEPRPAVRPAVTGKQWKTQCAAVIADRLDGGVARPVPAKVPAAVSPAPRRPATPFSEVIA